jgi:hypothetical protein
LKAEYALTLMSLVAAWSPLARAQETTLHFRADPTMIDVTFDRARVSPEDVKRWMKLSDFISSENGYQVPPSLGLCRRDDPRYVGCGAAQEFPDLHNAAVNLNEIRKNITDLDPNRFPADLSRVVLYLRQIQNFSLWANTQQLEFLEKRNVPALESAFQKIDPKKSCGTVLDQIRDTSDKLAAWTLAQHDWYNCVLREELDQIGPYPHKAWESFLSAHGIREHVSQEEVN